MKRTIILVGLLLGFLSSAFAQFQACGMDSSGKIVCPMFVEYVDTNPSGSCDYTRTTINRSTGIIRSCRSGTWADSPSGGGGTMVYPGLGVARSDGNGWLTSYTVGTAANNLVQLNSSAQLPGVSAALLTNFPTLNQNTTGTAAGLTAQYINWNATTGGTSIANKPTLGGAALLDVGTTTGTVAAGDDTRMTNARTPTAHASSHASGQSDAVSPSSIGAVPAQTGTGALMVNSGVVEKVTGNATDCVLVNGSSATCGTGGGIGYPGAGVPKSTGTAWDTSYTAGTGANNLLQLDAGGKVPAANIPNALSSTTSVNGTTIPASAALMTTTTNVAASQMPAFTNDVNTTAGTVAATVVGVNGASVPASSPLAGTNGTSQIVAATAANVSGVQYVAGGGNAQAQTATLAPAVTSLVAGLHVCWLPVAANTATAPTLAVNGLAAKPITKSGTTALVANDLTTTAVACAVYDGTQFQLQNPQAVLSSSGGISAGSTFEASGNEEVAPTTSVPTIFFDSTAHLPQYKNASDTLVGTMVAPEASRTANQFCTHVTAAGVCSKAAIVGADLPFPGASAKGGVLTTTCSSGQVADGYQTDGTPHCVTVSGSGSGKTGSGTIDFPLLTDGQRATGTFTLTGAVVGDSLAPAWPTAAAELQGKMYVSAADTVTVLVTNDSGGDVDAASATYGATVNGGSSNYYQLTAAGVPIAVAATLTGYAQFSGGWGTTMPGSDYYRAFPVSAVTLSNWRLCTQTAQGASGSLVLTLQKNGADTALTITIPAGSAYGCFADTTHSVAYADNDTASVKLVNNMTTGTGNSASINGWSFKAQ